MLKEQIAASLENTFSQHGFAVPSVSQLKTACNVSLRTLYKHYPSKDAMIVGALEHRHQRYLAFLLTESPSGGVESVLHIFDRLVLWMDAFAPHGCLSMNAIAAFPDNLLITKAVTAHKEDVLKFLCQQSQRPDLAAAIFLIHEGVSSSWAMQGQEALITAKQLLLQLLKDNK